MGGKLPRSEPGQRSDRQAQAKDYLISVAEKHLSLSDLRKRCLQSDTEDRLRLVGVLSQPLPVRALATWLSSGVESRGGPRSGGGSKTPLARLLQRLGVSEEFLSATKWATKRTREPSTVLVPLIWLESQRDQPARLSKNDIPESPVLDGIPMYAFDKHVRLGLAAIQKLTRESDDLRAWLAQFIPKEAWLKAVKMAAFYTDTPLIARRLNWYLSRPLELLGYRV